MLTCAATAVALRLKASITRQKVITLTIYADNNMRVLLYYPICSIYGGTCLLVYRRISVMPLFFLVFLAVFCRGAWSKSAKKEITAEDIERTFSLVKTGSLSEIKSDIRHNKNIATAADINGNTLLMAALEAGRDRKIISYLIRITDKDALNNIGESTATFVCRYSSDKKIIKKILKRKPASKKDIRERLLYEDNNGVAVYEYALDNPSPIPRQIAFPYLHKDDMEMFAIRGRALAAKQKTQENTNEPAALITSVAPVLSAQSNTDDTPLEPSESSEPSKAEEAQNRYEQNGDSNDSFTDISAYPAEGYLPIPIYEEKPDKKDAIIDDANRRGKNGITPLMSAAKKGNGWEVTALLDSGANVNDADDDGWTALMYAARYQMNNGIIISLLDAGADAHRANNYGFTALSIAARYNENPDVCGSLIKKFASGEDEVFHAFIVAVTTNSTEEIRLAKVRLFMEHRVPINDYWEGKTAIMYAASSCNGTGTLKILLDNGAVPSLLSYDGKTAFDYASENKELPHDDVFWSLKSK